MKKISQSFELSPKTVGRSDFLDNQPMSLIATNELGNKQTKVIPKESWWINEHR